jgi:ComF family protein
MWIFARLLDLIFPLRDTGKVIRDCTEESFGKLVSPTTKNGVVSLLPYRHPIVRSAIIEAKFRKNPKAFTLLGSALADYLAALKEEGEGFEKQEYVVVPIPLGEKRQKERGYNQIEEIAHAGGVQTHSLLSRPRETAAQTSLRRKERLTNMHEAFAATGEINPIYTYVLVDDVSTTGTTLLSAKDALNKGGGTLVISVALAH